MPCTAGTWPIPSASSDAPPSTWTSERAHGVLRLLLAGHFKAVPEQRLRANFADLLPQPADDSNPGIQPDDEDPIDVGSREINPTGANPTDAHPADADPADAGPRPPGTDVIASPVYQHGSRSAGALLFNAVNLFA